MTDKLATQDAHALAERPSFLTKGDVTGTENIGVDDLRLPRLAIAQGLSEQLIESSSNYIAGLKMGDLFNDLTSTVYGKGPVTFIPVRRDVRRIEFVPRSAGGGILDMDVKAGDPRCNWTVVDGQRVPPKATKFVEFVILVLKDGEQPEAIVFSIKDTNKWNRRASEKLTGLIKLRNAPIYAGVYTLSVVSERNDKGTFGVPVVANAGWATEADFKYAEAFAANIAGRTIVVEREAGSDDVDAEEDGKTPF